jgi:4-amino-4-deoxy-L-arabinose transferase-like glycosyltransferase
MPADDHGRRAVRPPAHADDDAGGVPAEGALSRDRPTEGALSRERSTEGAMSRDRSTDGALSRDRSTEGALVRGRVLLVLLAVFAVVWFGNLDYRKLVKTDEGRYAEIAREMVATGDWLTPRQNGYKYFYKPPLQYWATAAAFTAFGIDEWTARLWTALTGFCGVLVTWFVALRLWGRDVALLAASVLGGSVMWIAMGHFAALDMGLAFFLSTAVSAFVFAQRDDATARERRNGMLVAWLAAGLAVMSKGLIGIVLPGGAFVAYLAWSRQWSLLGRLHPVGGLALLLAVTVPWFVAVSLANPEFFHFFFIHEHFERFLTKVHGRYEPPWYFIPVLLAGLLPWTLLLGHAVRAGLRRATTAFSPERFLLAWIGVVFLFFSASSSKLPSYIVPIWPALAMLAALGLARAGRGMRRATWITIAVLGVVVAFVATGAAERGRSATPAALLAAYEPWLVGCGVVFAVGAAIAWVLDARGRRAAAVLAASAGSLVGTQLAITGHESLAPVMSSYHVAREIAPRLAPDAPFFAVDTYDHTLPFYLRRTLTMVAYKDELAASIAWEPARFLPDYAAFRAAWAAAPRAYAFMDPREYEGFAKEGLPMTVIARDPRRVIVEKPPAPEAGR